MGRIIIGLTLAVNENFVILFIVIIFHRKYTVILFEHLAHTRRNVRRSWSRLPTGRPPPSTQIQLDPIRRGFDLLYLHTHRDGRWTGNNPDV